MCPFLKQLGQLCVWNFGHTNYRMAKLQVFPAKIQNWITVMIFTLTGELSNGQLRWSSLPRYMWRTARGCQWVCVLRPCLLFMLAWTLSSACVGEAGRERGKRLQKHNVIELSTLFLTNMCCHLVSLVEWCALPFWNELFARVIKAPKVSSPLFKEFVLVLSMPHQLPN